MLLSRFRSPLWLSVRQCSRSLCEPPPLKLAPLPPCFWSILPNGLRVISEITCSPLVCIGMFLEAGPRYEHPCNNGVSKFIEMMAFKGFSNYKKPLLIDMLSCRGVKVRVHTGRDHQVFLATGGADCVPDMINVFSRIINDLALDDDEMYCARQQHYELVQEIDHNYEDLAFDFVHECAFQETPLSMPVSGSRENILKLDKSAIREFMTENYVPSRIVLSVSSKFSHHDVVCMVQNNFCCIQETGSDFVYWPCRFSGGVVKFRDDSMDFSHNIIAFETEGYDSEDFFALNILAELIGSWNVGQAQGFGTSPKLAYASSVSGLCSAYKAFYLPYRDVGLFGVYFEVENGVDIDDMVAMVMDLLKNKCLATTSPELKPALNALKMRYTKNVTGCVNSVIDMGTQMLYTGCRKDLLELYETAKLNAKVEKLRSTAMKYIYDRCPAVSSIGPNETLPDYTRIRAKSYYVMY